MHSRRLICTLGVILLTTAITLGISRASMAQTNTKLILAVLEAVVNQRIPAVTNTEMWGYRYPVASKFVPVGQKPCSGEFVYLYGDDPNSGQRDLWGAVSIQQCPTDADASKLMQSYQPDYLKTFDPNAGVSASTPYEWLGMEARFLNVNDLAYTECSEPFLEQIGAAVEKCSHMRPKEACTGSVDEWGNCYADPSQGFNMDPMEGFKDPMEGFDPDSSGPELKAVPPQPISIAPCVRISTVDATAGLEACPGRPYHAYIDVWRSANYVFLAQEPEPEVVSLSTVLSGCQGCPSLKDILREEADRAGLTALQGQAPAVQPAAPGLDTDNDGFPDTRDRCRTQPAPQSADGCPDYTVIIQCGPPDVEEGMDIACMAEVSGSPDADTVDLEWDVDGKPICSGKACQWKAGGTGITGHNVSVTAKGKPSGKQTVATTWILVRTALRRPSDDPSSNLVITNLGCSSDVTSDDRMDCLVGFKRLDPKIQELVVIWEINGATASTSTRTDDGDTYSLSQPAPGVHTIRVYVLDPNNAGRGRVMTTTARILPGKNATIPPGAGAGAAAGTLTGIGVWLWAQWWFASRPGGKVKPGSPISKLPTSPRVDRSYSGGDAKTILEQLGIYNELKRLGGADFMDPEFRAKVEEVLDTHFGKRKVKGIHYKVGPNGEIDVNSIEIVVEEPEGARHPRNIKPKPPKSAPPKKAKPPVKPKPAAQPPQTKKPPVKIPPVDKKEQELRKKWKDEQKAFRNEARKADKAREARNKANDALEKAKAKLDAAIEVRLKHGVVDTGLLTAQLVAELAALWAGAKIPGSPFTTGIGWNLLAQTLKNYWTGESAGVGEHLYKSIGGPAWEKLLFGVPDRVPSGLIKDLIQWSLKAPGRTEIPGYSPPPRFPGFTPPDPFPRDVLTKENAAKAYGIAAKIANIILENRERTAEIGNISGDKAKAFQNMLDRGTDFQNRRVDRNAERRHVQYAWDELQEYLRNKRTAATR